MVINQNDAIRCETDAHDGVEATLSFHHSRQVTATAVPDLGSLIRTPEDKKVVMAVFNKRRLTFDGLEEQLLIKRADNGAGTSKGKGPLIREGQLAGQLAFPTTRNINTRDYRCPQTERPAVSNNVFNRLGNRGARKVPVNVEDKSHSHPRNEV